MNLKLTRENIWLCIVCFTLCTFSFSERLNSWGVLLLGIFFLADKNLLAKIKNKTVDLKILPMVGFFLLFGVFYLFSEQHDTAYHSMLTKFTFLVFPLLFYYESYFTPQNEKILLLIFSVVLSCGFVYESSASLYNNYYLLEQKNLSYALGRMQISEAIMHPGYYSNYFMFGILWQYFNKNKYAPLFIVVFTIALSLLLSRIVILFYIVFLIYVAFRYAKQSTSPLYTAGKLTIIGLIACVAIYNVPLVNERIQETVSGINNSHSATTVSAATASRRIAYEYELRLIQQQFIMGYGLGNSREVLTHALNQNGFASLGAGMNTHSQFMNIWLQMGLIGILYLIGMLAYLFNYFKSKKEWVAFWFVILVAMNLMTDDMLDIQAGVVFFVLIWSLYLTRPQLKGS